MDKLESATSGEITEQLKRFALYLAVDKGLGKKTVDLDVRITRRFLEESGTPNVTHDCFREYVRRMYEKGVSHSHSANTLTAIEWYFKFLGVPIHFERPRKRIRIVEETLTEAEVAVLIDACKDSREKAVLSILAYSGARNDEICKVKVGDVDFGNGFIRVIGKGNKERIAFITGDCVNVVMKYLAEFPRKAHEYLFTTVRHGFQMDPCFIRRMVSRITRRTKVEKRVHPHLFRHSLATNMLDRGANPVTIQEQLGHAHLVTTMIYVHSRKRRVEAEYRIYAPSYT